MHFTSDVRLITIPTSDDAFRAHVTRLKRASGEASAGEFEKRLRALFPRAVVRAREIVNEPPAWYVYRDGGWSSSLTGPWWEQADLPRLTVSADGWLIEASSTARSILGIDSEDLSHRHFTDFVAPGTLDDSLELFRVVRGGRDLTATVLLSPTSGEVIAVDVRATRDRDGIAAVFRLAEDVLPVSVGTPMARPREIRCRPTSDVAFASYASAALARMSEPTVQGLVLRLHRLYPHATVTAERDHWTVERDAGLAPEPGWWNEPDLPRVRYDAQALILEANSSVESFVGRRMVGRYWQEFVTPGSTEQVAAMLEILGEVGTAESRFRIPAADGSLVEFDSFTEVDGETFTTIMRPRV
jgi:PAS domain-containing protein